MDLLDAIRTCGAMRYLRPDPVPEAVLRRILEAATCAPSPGNSQGWDFVVVTDAQVRRELSCEVAAAVGAVLPPVPASGPYRGMLEGAHHLVEHLDEVPVWIFVCGRPVYPASAPSADWIAPALYPAAQNLVLAARCEGLGSVFTAYHSIPEARVREILRLPAEVRIAVTVLLGYPDRPFRPVRRKPLETVVHRDRW